MVPPGGHGRLIDIDIGRPGRIKANRLKVRISVRVRDIVLVWVSDEVKIKVRIKVSRA